MNIDRFLLWADSRHFLAVRTFVLGVTVWMTWQITVWAFLLTNVWLAKNTPTGLELAAVIAAVTLPFTALQTWAFKYYMEAKDR